MAGADPDPRPSEPLDWAASFTVRTDLPCASVGVYARAEIPTAARQPVAWRLLDAATDQPLGTLVPGAAEEAPYVLERFVAARAPVCLRLAALGVDGTTTTSSQIHCYPPHVLDAGISDSEGETDAGLPLPDDAGLTVPDAGAMPPDAGPPAGLASSQDGCGCSAMPAAGPWSDVLAVAVLLGLAARRRRPRRTQRSRSRE